MLVFVVDYPLGRPYTLIRDAAVNDVTALVCSVVETMTDNGRLFVPPTLLASEFEYLSSQPCIRGDRMLLHVCCWCTCVIPCGLDRCHCKQRCRGSCSHCVFFVVHGGGEFPSCRGRGVTLWPEIVLVGMFIEAFAVQGRGFLELVDGFDDMDDPTRKASFAEALAASWKLAAACSPCFRGFVSGVRFGVVAVGSVEL
jgi:hypothetical protein